jgi:transposase
MLFVGIDWSRNVLEYDSRMITGDGPCSGCVATTREGIDELSRTLREKAGGQPVAIAFESVGAPWVQALLDAGFVLYPVNPKMAELFRKSASLAGGKSDRLDAEMLARLLVTFIDRLKPLRPDAPEIIALRIACQDRVKLVEQRVAWGLELADTLRNVYPAMLDFFGNLESRIALEFVHQFPTQDQMRGLTPRRLQSWLKRQHYSCPSRVPEMQAALTQPGLAVPPFIQQAKAMQIRFLAESLMRLDEEIAARDRQLAQQLDALPEAGWAKSLPGAGPTLAPAIVACFGRDPERFADRAAAQAYMGTAPVTKASGKSHAVTFRRSCWKFARRTLYLFATQSLLKGCAWVRQVYDRQIAHGKRHATAIRVVAHKWVKIILAMQRTQTHYDENRFMTRRATTLSTAAG